MLDQAEVLVTIEDFCIGLDDFFDDAENEVDKLRETNAPLSECFGRMAGAIRVYDWLHTPLGPPA